ncbi:MAG: hypothetical protein DMD86_17345 [Candidatus Rokuibacteriota bacterium]|nr:MAG: hypothetical protein DMD86_17345 [Candidatus Rokubacteria bacterium]
MSRSLGWHASVLALVAGLTFAGAALAQEHWTAPASEKAKKNPLPNDKKVIEQGENVAKINCAPCHGAKGKGDGAAAVALNPKPADWTADHVQRETAQEVGGCEPGSAPTGGILSHGSSSGCLHGR